MSLRRDRLSHPSHRLLKPTAIHCRLHWFCRNRAAMSLIEPTTATKTVSTAERSNASCSLFSCTVGETMTISHPATKRIDMMFFSLSMSIPFALGRQAWKPGRSIGVTMPQSLPLPITPTVFSVRIGVTICSSRAKSGHLRDLPKIRRPDLDVQQQTPGSNYPCKKPRVGASLSRCRCATNYPRGLR